MKIILAGGGTGGHVIPALAIAEQLRRDGHIAAFVGTARGIENRLVPNAGFPLYLVKVGALNRVSLATRLRTLIDLPMSIIDAIRILRAFHADAVIGVGGYAAGPATIAAVLLRIPVVLFEPNVVPGYANRALARFAAKAAVHFEQTGRWFRRFGVPVEVTGVPVRPAFFALPARRSPQPTLLVFGGSQGARALNRVVSQTAAELIRRIPGLRIVHQTGSREYDELRDVYTGQQIGVEVSPFIDDMPQQFADADLIVCRSGASTVAEVAAAGKCALFVPFPGAADDHQLRNAEALAHPGAALLIPESELSAEIFVNEVTDLLRSPERLKEMEGKARALAHPDAAAHIVAMALSAAKRS